MGISLPLFLLAGELTRDLGQCHRTEWVVGVRIGVVMVVAMVVTVRMAMRMAVIMRFTKTDQRQRMAVDKCVAVLVVMRVRVVVAMIVRGERRPGQAVGFAERLVAAR
jgi:hypothetical protein